MSRLQQQLLQAPAPQELTAQLTFPFPALDPPSNQLSHLELNLPESTTSRKSHSCFTSLAPTKITPTSGRQNVQLQADGRSAARVSSVQQGWRSSHVLGGARRRQDCARITLNLPHSKHTPQWSAAVFRQQPLLGPPPHHHHHLLHYH